MTSAFSARRRADEFEALLTRGPTPRSPTARPPAFAELVALVSDLRALPEVAPRAEFVGSLRERLMAEADTVLVRQPPAPQRLAMPSTTRPRERRLAALLGGAALVGATATMAVAAQTSLPGESLYGVKRGIESAEVRLAGDDADRGRTLLAQAETRLTELEELAAGSGGAEQLIPDTLDTFTEQSGEGVRSLLTSYGSGGSDDDVQVARAFTSASMERLDALQGQLPDERARRAARRRSHAHRPRHRDQHGLRPVRRRAHHDARLPAQQCGDRPGRGPRHRRADPGGGAVSGQDVSGITIPKALQSPGGLLPEPTGTSTPTARPCRRTSSRRHACPADARPQTPTATPTTGRPARSRSRTSPRTVTDTTSNLTTQLDEVTGGAIGGLTGARSTTRPAA